MEAMNRYLLASLVAGCLTLGVLAGCPTPRPSATLVLSPTSAAPSASGPSVGPSMAPTVTPSPSASAAPVTVPTPVPGESPTVVHAVGDIAMAASSGDEATAQLLDTLAGPILTLGDSVYENGTASEFQQVFDPSWGRHKSRIRPVPGNHEYNTPEAAGYFGYFGAAAGDPGKGFYAYDLGPHWRVIAINSELEARFSGGGLESLQLEWLEQELKASAGKHVLALWHHPRYSSGIHGDSPFMEPMWDLLVAHGAELVLAGHDHLYERFAPLNQDGQRDAARGLRSFVVGTGGAQLYPITDGVGPNSEAHNDKTWGVLALRLYSNRYEWEFVPVAGQTYRDRGESACH